MTKTPAIHKSFLLRMCMSGTDQAKLKRIRLETVADKGEVHHFTNLDDMVDFLLEMLQISTATQTK